MKILIVEDDFTSRVMLSAVLSRNGHEVVEAANGAEAWEILQQHDAPRLVILDWMMPEMDGIEVLRRICTLPTTCPPYVIMQTSRGGTVDIIAGLKAGANDYMTKPIEHNEILARVEVGQRIIDMEEQHCRRQEKAQLFRVEAARRINELQKELAFREKELQEARTALLDADRILSERLGGDFSGCK